MILSRITLFLHMYARVCHLLTTAVTVNTLKVFGIIYFLLDYTLKSLCA